MSILKIEHINTGYGKKQVLFDVNLEVQEGETVLLVGANGSGKSTLLKIIYRMLPVWHINGFGSCIEFGKLNLLNAKPTQMIQTGMVYIPQKNELFEGMSVKQNLETSLLHLTDKKETRIRIEELFDMLPTLRAKSKQSSSSLSGGERKTLSLGMAMLNRPKFLMIDEPLAGVSIDRIEQVKQIIQMIKDKGTSMIIVEHRLKELFDFADGVLGMKQGELRTDKIENIDMAKLFLV